MIRKKVKFPKKKTHNEMISFFKDLNLEKQINKNHSLDINLLRKSLPYPPDMSDLYRIYEFITLNKRTTILEFGSGWSSLIMSLALGENLKKHKNDIKDLRRNNPFELFVVDNENKYLSVSKKRIQDYKKINKSKILSKVNWLFSEVSMTLFEGRFATEYKTLPLCNPDFIYLDAPDQFNIKGKINGFNIGHNDLMPMCCDILKIEHFLVPGTIILIDGRGANAQFLKYHFKRNWIFIYEKIFDQYVLYLDEKSIGPLNDRQLKFYKS